MINVDWQTVSQYVDTIYDGVTKRLDGERLNTVIGIARGGLIPAVMLSHRFNTRLVSLQWQTRDQNRKVDEDTLSSEVIIACNHSDNVLIVDDIVDSGKTLKDINTSITSYLRWMNNRRCGDEKHINVIYACLVKKIDIGFDVISGIEICDDRWVVFPWESKPHS